MRPLVIFASAPPARFLHATPALAPASNPKEKQRPSHWREFWARSSHGTCKISSSNDPPVPAFCKILGIRADGRWCPSKNCMMRTKYYSRCGDGVRVVNRVHSEGFGATSAVGARRALFTSSSKAPSTIALIGPNLRERRRKKEAPVSAAINRTDLRIFPQWMLAACSQCR